MTASSLRCVRNARGMTTASKTTAAHRRAHDGVDKPIVYQGVVTDTYKEYSDSLLQMLMKGYKKEKYADRKELSGSVGRPLTLDTETKEDVVSSILGMITSKPDPVE